MVPIDAASMMASILFNRFDFMVTSPMSINWLSKSLACRDTIPKICSATSPSTVAVALLHGFVRVFRRALAEAVEYGELVLPFLVSL